MANGGFWTDDKVDALKALLLDGLSHSQIKKKIGAPSRCAVAGKVFRLGLSKPVDRAQKIGAEHSKIRPKKSKFAVREVHAAPPPETRFKPLPGCTPRALMDLVPQDCRWPLDGETVTFCCLPADDGPYCPAHARMAYIPLEEPPERYIRGLRRWAA